MVASYNAQTGVFSLEAPVDTKAQRAKVPKSDYGHPDHPDGPKYPITTQAQVMSAARLLGKIPDEATRAKVKARIKRIANRKGFTLPKAWQGEKTGKKAKEAVQLSDDDVRWAFQCALDNDGDPDGDGDDDRDAGDDPWSRPRCWVSATFRDETPVRGIYSWDGDDEADDGLYQRTFTIDANGKVVLNDDIKRVVRVVTYADYAEQPEEGQEARVDKPPGVPVRESSTVVETDGSFTINRYEAGDGKHKGTIRGTAIKPGFNKSRARYYPKETLAASVESLVNKKMYIDHPSTIDDRTRPERSIRDQAALVTNAWVQEDGSIGYEATIFDTWLDERVAKMAERGVLGAMATSVNYQGTQESAVIEGVRTSRIDGMAYNSLDFVTEAGAWGDVAHLESADPEGEAPRGVAAEEQDVAVDEKEFQRLEALITGLTTQITTLTETADKNEHRAIKAETRTAVKDLLAESLLPKLAQEKIAKEWDGRESVDGLADRIAAEVSYVEAMTGKKLEAPAEGGESGVEAERAKIRGLRTPKRVVVGNGAGAAAEGGREAAPAFTPSTEWLFGSRESAKQFEERFVS